MIGLLIHKNHGDMNVILNESRKTFDKIFTINDFKYEEKNVFICRMLKSLSLILCCINSCKSLKRG